MTACVYLKAAVLGSGSQSGVLMCPRLFLPVLILSPVRDTGPASSIPLSCCCLPGRSGGACPTPLGQLGQNPDAGRWLGPLVAAEAAPPPTPGLGGNGVEVEGWGVARCPGGGHSRAPEGQWQWWLRQHPRLTVPLMGLNKPLPSLVPASALPVDSVGNSVPFQ